MQKITLATCGGGGLVGFGQHLELCGRPRGGGGGGGSGFWIILVTLDGFTPTHTRYTCTRHTRHTRTHTHAILGTHASCGEYLLPPSTLKFAYVYVVGHYIVRTPDVMKGVGGGGGGVTTRARPSSVKCIVLNVRRPTVPCPSPSVP